VVRARTARTCRRLALPGSGAAAALAGAGGEATAGAGPGIPAPAAGAVAQAAGDGRSACAPRGALFGRLARAGRPGTLTLAWTPDALGAPLRGSMQRSSGCRWGAVQAPLAYCSFLNNKSTESTRLTQTTHSKLSIWRLAKAQRCADTPKLNPATRVLRLECRVQHTDTNVVLFLHVW